LIQRTSRQDQAILKENKLHRPSNGSFLIVEAVESQLSRRNASAAGLVGELCPCERCVSQSPGLQTSFSGKASMDMVGIDVVRQRKMRDFYSSVLFKERCLDGLVLLD
jgi:hypothetical protein